MTGGEGGRKGERMRVREMSRTEEDRRVRERESRVLVACGA